MHKRFEFVAVRARQVPGRTVLAFAAKSSDVLEIAEIDRVARDAQGDLHGFQRHQVAAHIKEIRDYLAHDSALLPNAVVLAFIEHVQVEDRANGTALLRVSIPEGDKPGYVVDGQQRLSALSGLDKPEFEIFVTALICEDYDEMREHFIRINSTRPLPKALIYELLPTVDGLPDRYNSRQFAAKLVAMLNFVKPKRDNKPPPLFERIKQHTNPAGTISDIALQKLIMNSISDGAFRELLREPGPHEHDAYLIINTFFSAVQNAFPEAWVDMTPKTSRLVHGAGIVAMGFVMEFLYSRSRLSIEFIREQPERLYAAFIDGLELLRDGTAWTSGHWHFGRENVRSWNAIQNTSSDIALLSGYLVSTLRRRMDALTRVAAA